MNSPLVSVVMSVYNTPEEFLRASVASILNQTHKNLEFLIVDDCSKPATQNVLRELALKDRRIRILTNLENLGLTKSLNRAIDQAKGDYVARMDADDVSANNRFEEQIKYLERKPEIDVLGTEYYLLKGEKRVRPRKRPNQPWQIQGRLLFGCQGILHPSVMFRAELFKKHGVRYDGKFRIAQDFELWSRIGLKYNIYVLPQYLVDYRISDAQVSVAKRDQQIKYRNRVLFNALRALGIEPTREERVLHVQFCHGKAAQSVDAIVDWAERLLEANEKRRLYHPVSFEYYVRKREFDAAFHTSIKTAPSVKNYANVGQIAIQAAKATRKFQKLAAAKKKDYE